MHNEPTRSAFFPLLVLAVTVAGWALFQTIQLSGERKSLTALIAKQEPVVQNAHKLRTQLQGIAMETQQLATAGNPNAKKIVDELHRRGINIGNPPENPKAPQSKP